MRSLLKVWLLMWVFGVWVLLGQFTPSQPVEHWIYATIAIGVVSGGLVWAWRDGPPGGMGGA